MRWALLVVCCALGCTRERGDADFGEECRSDFDCAHGYCVQGAGDAAPACTRTCADNTECPDGWSCSGVTESGVVVCTRGSATPFGY